MTTPFDDAAVGKHDDVIGVFDGREAVSDYKRCAIFHEIFQRALHQALRFIVQCGGRFV